MKLKPRKVKQAPQAPYTGPQAPEQVPMLQVDGCPPYPVPWPIKVYDIGKVGFVGVRYPDSYQEQSLNWWRKRLDAAGVDYSHLDVVPKPALSPGKATVRQDPPPEPEQQKSGLKPRAVTK
jgi:hypothetical protein